MSTLTPNKTVQSPLISRQNVAAGGVVISSVFDYSGKLGGTVFPRFGRRSASASTGSALIRVEASMATTGDNSWFPIPGGILVTNYAAVQNQAVSGTCNSGQAVIGLASTSNFVLGGTVYIDNGTAANSEWGIIKAIATNTSITLEDNLVNAQTGSTVYAGAQIFDAIDVGPGYTRLRVVCAGQATTQNFAIEVGFVTLDSMSIA